jgi:lysozyme
VNYIRILHTALPIDEGTHRRMYRCPAGFLTIGVGHNLEAKPISARAVQVILEDDIADAEADARALFHVFDRLSEARKAVLVNMSFNLGKSRLSRFVKFITAVNTGNFEQAVVEMMDSRWAEQVGDRAKRLANMMTEG